MNECDFTWPGRIHDDPAHDLVVAYLTIDIQHSPQWTNELLQHLKMVEYGQIPSWERTGNAYCLRIYPDHIEIEDDYADEVGELLKISLVDFELIVKSWQEFIKKKLSCSSNSLSHP